MNSFFVSLGILGSIITFFYICMLLFAHFFANKMIFPAPPTSYENLPNLFFIENKKHGLRVASITLEAKNPKGFLLYCHGNGEDIGDLYPLFLEFQSRGYTILAFDYPGYGLTEGECSEKNCYLSARTTYLWFLENYTISSEEVFVYGRSLGGGSAFYLASEFNLGGLIVEGTFLSTYRVMTRVKLIHRDCFDNLAKLPKIQSPLLVIHGKQDKTVPFRHGEVLFHQYQGMKSKLWLPNASHNDVIEKGGEVYWRCLQEFIQFK